MRLLYLNLSLNLGVTNWYQSKAVCRTQTSVETVDFRDFIFALFISLLTLLSCYFIKIIYSYPLFYLCKHIDSNS